VRREEILRATVAEVERRGFAGTRVADVATALGVSPALVFYHFESKDSLLSAAFEYAANRDLERLDAAATGPGSALDRLCVVPMRRTLQINNLGGGHFHATFPLGPGKGIAPHEARDGESKMRIASCELR